ncbi:MAG: HAMP domain-containing histidine kinase [Lachnospiraceae bacterium]|nr:HAMP domain-containing histidine kinase [Lachnospiraceae bacterium]
MNLEFSPKVRTWMCYLWAIVPTVFFGLFFDFLWDARLWMVVTVGVLAIVCTWTYCAVFRGEKTRIPVEISILSIALAFWCIYYKVDLYDWLNQLNYYRYDDVSEYTLVLLFSFPVAYCMVLCVRSLMAVFSGKMLRSHSLVFRAAAFLGNGRSLRRKLFLEIIAAALLTALITVVLLVNFALRDPSILWLVPAILLVETVSLCALLLGRQSAAAEMEQLANVIEEGAAGTFPQENPLPARSPFAQTGEAVVRLGNLTEEGIRKGIAGEKLKVDLITNVSHDLRTPLTSVIGYAQELSRMELPENAQEMSEKILYKSRYLNELVNDLFELSKTASGNANLIVGELSLNRLAAQTVAEMQDKIEASGFAVVEQYQEGELMISTDGMRLHRVLQNLLDNALKYSQPGTRIFVTTTEEEEAILRVINTAATTEGLSEMDLTERFTRGDTSRSTEGSGLGLAIARTYVEAVGGRFTITIRGDQFEAEIRLPKEFDRHL